ncbi:MAG: serine/threonine-protein kinase [Rhodocyclaceae bacterium]|jgi:serine/threonine protein kinase|nr:serine/threonine-protein kinase [Rhodocyclaceae bacterium]
MEKIGGKYEVVRPLGEGATSTVYLAYDPFAEREVAVKLISPDILKDRERGRQFRHLLINEASLAGKLIHPHIVQIYDAVIGDEESYIVMEYVTGGTLERFCDTGNLLPIERIVEIVFKCTRALEYANRLGITHRDIKPANILLVNPEGEDGDIKISDFGACIQTGAEQTQTQVMGVGSPAYMSPQQLQEQTLNHQTDIYALGVVMYQLLAGRLPFQASSNYGIIYQICNIDPPPPSTFREGIPPALDAVVARAMQKELQNRYASWAEFAHDLAEAFRSGQRAAPRKAIPDSEKFETLRALAFFNDFSDVELWEVVRFAQWEEVSATTRIMADGEPGDHFCFVLDGEVDVAKEGRALGTLGQGELIGEMAVIDRRHPRRAADVVARTQARIVVIPGTALRHASDACRMHFYEGFLTVLAGRLARTNTLLAHA